MDVGAWLRGLGLGRYEGTFRDNAIDAEVLPDLTEADLEKLGVLLGHRKKLLRAIAELREPFAEPDAATPAPPAHEPTAERRQLTVMFADLVGSTALSGRLDPEEMSEVIRGYQTAVAGEVTRFGGHIAQYLGDGVLAYFSYPRAHEDDAERAVRAGLGVVEAIADLKPRHEARLQVRIGIATGLVLVGELIGEGAAREEAVVGETPNLAARLQAIAEPGTVVIGPSTRRLVGSLFELDDLGPRALKGFVEPVWAWRVLGPGRAASRFEARQAAGLTPLVGREEERGLLLRRWKLAKEGEGQVVLLVGEPGTGKSRLVRALRDRLAAEPHMPLRYQCSPYHTGSALYPVIDQLERAAGYQRDDAAETKLAKLETLLAQGAGDVAAVAPVVADLLSVPTGDRYPPLNVAPQVQKAMTFDALIDQLAGLAARQPVLMILEDLHWIDPSSIELFGLVIDSIQHLPALLVITFRPEFTPPWTGHAHVTSLALNRLDRRQGVAMVEHITGGKPLPAEVLDQIVAKADGVPLFVEELTKMVLESGLLRDAGEHYELAGPLPPLAIPSTLQDSLMARLDRLAPVKEVAQIGAVIGREFSQELVAAIAGRPGEQLCAALDQLVASELIFRRGTLPKMTYTFKHALIQDAAYHSLPRFRRQQLHARIAAVIEERWRDTAETQPELLAQHYTAAGDLERALRFWLAAGRHATERSANLEAVSHLKRGLELIGASPESATHARTELEFQLALGTPLIAAEGYTANDTVRAFARARELCEQLGEVGQRFQAIYGLWANHAMRAEHQKARHLAEEFLSLAEREADVVPTITAHRVLGWSLSLLGELTAGRHQLEGALALYEPERDRSLAFRYGQDPRMAALSILAWNVWLLGYPDQARALGSQALLEAKELNHAFTLAYATYMAGAAPKYLSRDFNGALEHSTALIAFSKDQGFPFWLAYGSGLYGALQARVQRGEDWIVVVEAAISDLDRLGLGWFRPLVLYGLADAHLVRHSPERAAHVIAQVLALVNETNERWIEPELHRLNGETMLLREAREVAGAESCFEQAIELARSQSARSWELRATASLARLWAEQGERQKGRDLLAPIYGSFSEGFDTPDLQDARALLDELR